MDRTWRVIDSGPCSASQNMALDEAIATSVRQKVHPPTLRFYGWDLPSVSIGCFQQASDIDAGYCSANRIPLVRRPTGGRAILHGDELTYSFSARTDDAPFSRGLLDTYRMISSSFSHALRKAGVAAEARQDREKGAVLSGSPLCFQSSSFGEILVQKRKVIGSAQKRWEDGLLQQGSIPFCLDEPAMRAVFSLPEGAGLKDSMSGMKDVLPALTIAALREMIMLCFEEVFAIRLVQSHPSQDEAALARLLEEEKYLQPRWTFRR